eukprot:62268-Amphidinium_carterae.1
MSHHFRKKQKFVQAGGEHTQIWPHLKLARRLSSHLLLNVSVKVSLVTVHCYVLSQSLQSMNGLSTP